MAVWRKWYHSTTGNRQRNGNASMHYFSLGVFRPLAKILFRGWGEGYAQSERHGNTSPSHLQKNWRRSNILIQSPLSESRGISHNPRISRIYWMLSVLLFSVPDRPVQFIDTLKLREPIGRIIRRLLPALRASVAQTMIEELHSVLGRACFIQTSALNYK